MAIKPFIDELSTLGKQILPEGASLWLYGSRARGDAREDSDWDLLLLLDKDKREPNDWERFCRPIDDFGFNRGQYMSPHLYTKREWQKMSFMPFVKNVEHDKIVLV